MQKLSHAARAGTKLAAEAVHLSSVVVSKAGAKAEETFERMEETIEARIEKMRSPPEKKKKKTTTPLGGGNHGRSAGGIRDRIHLFDSASKSSGVDYRHQGAPYRRATHRRNRGGSVVVADDVASRREEEDYDFEGGSNMAPVSVPPPCNPGCYSSGYTEKENEPNQQQNRPDVFTSMDGVKKLSPTFRRKKKKKHRNDMENGATYSPPVNPNYNHDNHDFESGDAKMAEPEEVYTDYEKHEEKSRDDTPQNNEMEMNHPPVWETANVKKKTRERKSRHFENNGDEAVDIADLNRAAAHAAIQDSKNKKKGNGQQHAAAAAASSSLYGNKQKRNNAKTSYGINQPKKRDKEQHSLIQSPLRKHIKMVHDSACSNAKCTMTKEPFPLFPPELGGQGGPTTSLALAAVANWDEERSVGHLDMLGSIVTGTVSNINKNKKRGGGVNNDKDSVRGNSEKEKGGKDEAALDLLTSAAFLFKHSRRNLG